MKCASFYQWSHKVFTVQCTYQYFKFVVLLWQAELGYFTGLRIEAIWYSIWPGLNNHDIPERKSVAIINRRVFGSNSIACIGLLSRDIFESIGYRKQSKFCDFVYERDEWVCIVRCSRVTGILLRLVCQSSIKYGSSLADNLNDLMPECRLYSSESILLAHALVSVVVHRGICYDVHKLSLC